MSQGPEAGEPGDEEKAAAEASAPAEEQAQPAAAQIPDRLYFRIGDVADLVGVKPYVLRYWETEFPLVSPQKSNTGQRVYRRTDVETLLMIKHLLYQERYSIEGARKRIAELRKEGELRSFRKGVAGELPEGRKRREELLTLARELEALASVPISRFFG
jgi:DNA-binding transcriptional MerR regulator